MPRIGNIQSKIVHLFERQATIKGEADVELIEMPFELFLTVSRYGDDAEAFSVLLTGVSTGSIEFGQAQAIHQTRNVVGLCMTTKIRLECR